LPAQWFRGNIKHQFAQHVVAQGAIRASYSLAEANSSNALRRSPAHEAICCWKTVFASLLLRQTRRQFEQSVLWVSRATGAFAFEVRAARGHDDMFGLNSQTL
jgi:hypothetical protein